MQKRKAAQRGEPIPTFGSETAYSAEDLREVHKYIAEWGNLIIPDALAAEFAAVRRERDQAAEKLAQAVRHILNGISKGTWTALEAALAEWGKEQGMTDSKSEQELMARLAEATLSFKETDALMEIIRSHVNAAVGAAVEACAKLAHVDPVPMSGTEHLQFTSGGESLESKIRTLYPAATGELSRRLAEARLEEGALWREHSVWEGSVEWADKRIAELTAAAKETP